MGWKEFDNSDFVKKLKKHSKDIKTKTINETFSIRDLLDMSVALFGFITMLNTTKLPNKVLDQYIEIGDFLNKIIEKSEGLRDLEELGGDDIIKVYKDNDKIDSHYVRTDFNLYHIYALSGVLSTMIDFPQNFTSRTSYINSVSLSKKLSDILTNRDGFSYMVCQFEKDIHLLLGDKNEDDS